MVNIHASWLDPHKTRKLTIVGSRKMLVFDDMQSTEKIWIYDKGVAPSEALAYGEDLRLRYGDITVPFVPMTEPLAAELRHFLACVRGEVTPRSSGRDGLAVVSVLEAADRSVAAGGATIAISHTLD
jgi:predicted dehydrogenase